MNSMPLIKLHDPDHPIYHRAFILPSVICLLLNFFPLFSVGNASTLTVSTFKGLQASLTHARPGDTILLKDGTYKIPPTSWAIQITTADLTVRSKSGRRERVIIQGMGMNAQPQHGFFVQADSVTIADLTVENVRYHCVQTAPGVNRLHIKNCILRNAGEQIVKIPTAPDSSPAKGGVIEDCLFEYSAGIGPRDYIGGIDVHNGKDWTVQNNIFKFIRSPGPGIAEYAIHFWNNSAGTLVEKNVIITCDRGIGFGMGNRGHSGGIIRNNIIYHDGSPGLNDVGISLESSPDTKILNNEVDLEGTYPSAIEYRFPATRNVLIAGNTTNKPIRMRDNAQATLQNNTLSAQPGWLTGTLKNLGIDLKK